MDSSDYSGFRQYLLSQKPRKDRVHRELWESNGATYNTYRKFLNHVREFGFPDEEDNLQNPDLPRPVRQRSFQDKTGGRIQPSLAFSGVENTIDGCHSPITVMSYGCLSSSVIALGTIHGGVWILHLNTSTHKLNKLLDHDEEVRDLDWSLDNSLLLSCSINGCVCLSGVDPPSVFRKWKAKTRTTCCKFHWLNQNLVIIGGGGSLYIFNCSTGAQVQRITITPSPSTYLTAMACTNSQICLGDSNGALRTYRSGFKNNTLQLTLIGSVMCHPYSSSSSGAAITGIDMRSYSTICKGQAILTSYEDATFAIYRITSSVNPRVELCTKLAMRPNERRVKAVWCPAIDIDQPEHIAIGGEHANVHIYDLESISDPPVLVNTLSSHESPVKCVCWSFDGHGLISGDENGTMVVWKRQENYRVMMNQSYG